MAAAIQARRLVLTRQGDGTPGPPVKRRIASAHELAGGSKAAGSHSWRDGSAAEADHVEGAELGEAERATRIRAATGCVVLLVVRVVEAACALVPEERHEVDVA